MAPKSSLLSHQPSKHEEEREESSSGEEEEEEEEDNENSSDEETEAGSSYDEGQNLGTLNNHKPPIPAPKLDPKSNSRGNGSDSDADSEESPSDYMLQPIGKGSESSSKRSRDEIQNSSLKSRKSSRSEEKKSASSSGGLGCITRLWSNEDEIAVLNGMIEFKTVKGLDPNADMGAFHSFIKGKLKVDYSRDQLRTKITRMKKRFFNALKKGVKGSDPVFSKPHEDLAFKISKKIWGKNENVKKEIKKVEKDVVVESEVVEREEDGEGGDFWSKYPNIDASFDNIKSNFPSLAPGGRMSLLKEKLSLIGNVKAKELDDKWKQLALEEMELSYKILALMKEQVQMAVDQ